MKILHASILGTLATAPLAAQTFADDFNNDTSGLYSIVQTADAAATFGFDYSTLGIPSAPNTPDSTTLGLKLEANVVSGAANAITLHTIVPATGTYVVKFDAWINANGPFPGGGGGSTEYLTCGVGGDGATVNLGTATGTGTGGWFMVDGEGGSSRDYRGYKNAGEQFAESGQFAAGLSSAGGGAHNNSDPYYAQFGGIDVGALQGGLFAQQTGSTNVGSGGFAWHEMEMRVVSNGGTGGATSVGWYIDGLRIATLDAGIGSSFVTDGAVTLGYSDIFASLSDNPALSFGLFDNLRFGTLAEATSFGAGCPGTGGTPTLTAANTPELGAVLQLDVANLDASVPLEVMVVGFSNTSGPLGPLPINLAIAGFGATCELLISNDLLFPFVAAGSSDSWPLPISDDPQILGYHLFFQLGSVDSTAPGGLAFSNGVDITIGL
ncbi:MAG: hypothetical protein H6835_21090 [Planctomycetes bacterium]|nr:hypothetical protein [Planctomycetota bacterium]